MIDFKRAKDRRGSYRVNWSQLKELDSEREPLGRIEHIPFHVGDARVASVPADEAMFTGVGHVDRLAHGIFALRLGGTAVHYTFSPAGMRQFAKSLTDMADLIERGGK